MEKLSGLDLFSGIGGLTIGLDRWVEPKVLCDIKPECRTLLAQRFPDVKVHDDVCTVGEAVEDGVFDILGGGFPCKFQNKCKSLVNV